MMGSTSCVGIRTVVALCNTVAVTQPQSRGCHYLAGASQQVLTYLYVSPYPGRPTQDSSEQSKCKCKCSESRVRPATDNWTLSASRLSLSLPTSSSRQHLGSCELSVCLLIPASLSVPPILLVQRNSWHFASRVLQVVASCCLLHPRARPSCSRTDKLESFLVPLTSQLSPRGLALASARLYDIE